MHKKFNRGHI